ncbi:uncharacterized protein LOC120490925 isoform X2 [Pimephales promelas]|uniref:uncharacterized protein LOC120490925 isoform X2 n=1 Tax=Pimephales promelas TaxID=90988 RepID=UPI001955AD77|nr:uncharacterized protein LOC120490925 isoform X2 [Pimephales promelas]
MYIKFIVVVAILLVVADGFTLRGPSAPLVALLGSSLVLPCYTDEPLLPVKGLEVKWRRTDSETLVHLFLEGESRPEVQQQDYQDRAHFFTDQIQHGNFSLRLDNLRAEDEGNYTCKVYSQQDSGETEVQIKDVERLLVSGSSRSTSAYVGDDVTLNCSVDSHIKPESIEEVSWSKTDEDEDIPVLLYQNKETFPGSSDLQYRDRVEFFTDEIPKGNFSLRLKSVRTEDKGVYICHVFAGGLSTNTTVVLEQLGFSSRHITVLFFCFVAGFGAVLLLCCLIYCRVKNTENSRTIWNLHLSLVFCPNVCMFSAFILWALTEGFLHETVTCCALFILRPVMLIWALSYLNYLKDDIKTWIRFFRITSELTVFTVVVYSVLFAHVWRKSAHDTKGHRRVVSGLYFVVVLLSCLILSGMDLITCSQERPRRASSFMQTRGFLFGIILLSVSQLFQLFSSFGSPSLAFVVVPWVPAVLLLCVPLLPGLQAKFNFLQRGWITLLWMITIPLLDMILYIYILLTILDKEKDYLGWICVILFLEVLKMVVVFEYCVTVFSFVLTRAEHSGNQRRQQKTETNQQRSNTLVLCNFIMYMFGAVGLVLLNSVTLTAELILKARNGERVLKDLRLIVFPSECVFALYWLILLMHAYWKDVTSKFTHNRKNTHQRHSRQLRDSAETHEMENLSAPDSALSQTQ